MAESRKTRPIRMNDAEWAELKRRGPDWLRNELSTSATAHDLAVNGTAWVRVWFDGEQIRSETVPAKDWRKGEEE